MWLGLIMCQSLCSKNPQARIPQGFGRLGWVDLRIGGVADGDAWRRMATHWGRLFHGTGLWSWGSPECFPKSVMISWYFMWLPPFSTQSFEHRNIIWGTWWIFCSFLGAQSWEIGHPTPRPLSSERPGHHRVSAESASVRDAVKRTLGRWQFFICREDFFPNTSRSWWGSQALNYVETLFCSKILQDQFFL